MQAFLFTVLSFLVALGLLIFVHELGHFLVAKRLGVLVERFSIGFGPVIRSWKGSETEYAVSAIPMGGYVKMLGEDDDDAALTQPERAFSTQSLGRRFAIVFAGPAMNFVFAFVAYAVLFGTTGVEVPLDEPRVGGVTAGMAAEAAGLQPGDRIIRIDGTPIETWAALSEIVRGSDGAPLQMVIEREGAERSIEITPSLEPVRNVFGEEAGTVYRIGIEASFAQEPVGPLAALTMAGRQTWSASTLVAEGLWRMVRGRVPLSELGGPIAIAKAAGQQARAGLSRFFGMLAFLSVNLAVLNLLPIPALDGGHLAFFAIEGLIRRPLQQRHREIAQQVGVLLLITLMVFVFYNDIHRLVQG